MDLNSIKHIYAVNHAFENWNKLFEKSSKTMLQIHMNNVCKQYAKQKLEDASRCVSGWPTGIKTESDIEDEIMAIPVD